VMAEKPKTIALPKFLLFIYYFFWFYYIIFMIY